MGDITSIKVKKATRNRLVSLGRKSETYDAVLNRLMDFFEKKRVDKP